MSYMLPILMLLLIFGIFASLMREGLWSNSLMLINVLLAGLAATDLFEPVAGWLTGMMPSGSIFWDLIALWGVFAVSLLLLRFATDRISRVKVRFKKPLEMVGSNLMAVWVAYVMLCFTSMTLHTAPLSRNFMWQAFRPEDPIFFGLKPDRQWLGFVQLVSRGSLARMATEEAPEAHVFDPKGEYMPKYASRREWYERTDTFTGAR